jgi:hypothetical protein
LKGGKAPSTAIRTGLSSAATLLAGCIIVVIAIAAQLKAKIFALLLTVSLSMVSTLEVEIGLMTNDGAKQSNTKP